MEIETLNKYKQAEHYFESLMNITNENFFTGQADPAFFFKRAKYFLKLAGQPDLAYKIIHIAGTSGKGTTVNHIANILKQAGYKVGWHVSPFVSVATEKIQINGKLISMKDLIELVEEMKPIINKVYEKMGPPSYFECWVIAALLYFKKQKVDYVVLETGCGGRFDATNAIKQKEYAIITNVGLDHTFMLGNTIAKIAFEKAGIIRDKGKVITTATRPTALKVIQQVCHDRGADLEILKNQTNPNQALAIQVCQHLGIDDYVIEQGLKQTRLPARFEIMQTKPLVIIDGAHNLDKIDYFVNQLKQTFPNLKEKKIHVICALADKKNPTQVFKSLKPITTKVYATRFLNSFRKAISPTELAKAFKGIQTQVFLDPQQALLTARKKAKSNDIILIIGSFYLCSDLRKNWISEEWQLDKRQSFCLTARKMRQ